jgi:hypothetical protein
MPARVSLVMPIALALLIPVISAVTALGSDERLGADHRTAELGATAPASLAQAQPAQLTTPPPQTEAPPAPPATQPAQTEEQPAQAPSLFGPAWRSSDTGRQIPDPTGTRFFRPAVSGGAGVVAW